MKLLSINEIKRHIRIYYPKLSSFSKEPKIIWADIDHDGQLELIVTAKGEKEHLLIFDYLENKYKLIFSKEFSSVGPISFINNIIIIKPMVGSGPNWQMSELQILIYYKGKIFIAWSGVAEEHTRFKCDTSSSYGSIFFDDNNILHHMVVNQLYDCDSNLEDTITTLKTYTWDGGSVKYVQTEKTIEYFKKEI